MTIEVVMFAKRFWGNLAAFVAADSICCLAIGGVFPGPLSLLTCLIFAMGCQAVDRFYLK